MGHMGNVQVCPTCSAVPNTIVRTLIREGEAESCQNGTEMQTHQWRLPESAGSLKQ